MTPEEHVLHDKLCELYKLPVIRGSNRDSCLVAEQGRVRLLSEWRRLIKSDALATTIGVMYDVRNVKAAFARLCRIELADKNTCLPTAKTTTESRPTISQTYSSTRRVLFFART